MCVDIPQLRELSAHRGIEARAPTSSWRLHSTAKRTSRTSRKHTHIGQGSQFRQALTGRMLQRGSRTRSHACASGKVPIFVMTVRRPADQPREQDYAARGSYPVGRPVPVHIRACIAVRLTLKSVCVRVCVCVQVDQECPVRMHSCNVACAATLFASAWPSIHECSRTVLCPS